MSSSAPIPVTVPPAFFAILRADLLYFGCAGPGAGIAFGSRVPARLRRPATKSALILPAARACASTARHGASRRARSTARSALPSTRAKWTSTRRPPRALMSGLTARRDERALPKPTSGTQRLPPILWRRPHDGRHRARSAPARNCDPLRSRGCPTSRRCASCRAAQVGLLGTTRGTRSGKSGTSRP